MDDPIRMAGQADISNLYHYQDFQAHLLHTERLVDILRNHRIYCSNPAAFNDPWDCKPYFDPNLLDDPANQAAAAEFLIAKQQDSPKGDEEGDLLRTSPAALKNFLQQFSEGLASFITERWGIYCLSSDPCLSLMWSHYSRNHEGICLEFATDNPIFRAALEVRYRKDYPPLLLHDQESWYQMLLIKSDVWTYEKEFRLICRRFAGVKEYGLIMDGDHLSIGANDLKSIIVGCQAEEGTIKAIKALVEEHAPSVAVRQAKRAPNKYSLVIEG